MTEAFAVDRSEPVGLWQGPEPAPESHPDLRALAFEFASRGDRVPGRLLLPPGGDGPFPVVLLQHGAHGSRREPYMADVAAPWVRAGAAVASIDFPLHGDRANAKLVHLLLGALGVDGTPSAAGREVLGEFVQQAVVDLRRALDALELVPAIDSSRIAYAGLSLGSIVGANFCAADPRPRAAALALGGGGFGGPEVDPARHVGRIAPRPLLLVNMRGDETVQPSATESLYAAAGEPKQLLWFDGGHRDLPGRALKAMWQLLRRALELTDPG